MRLNLVRVWEPTPPKDAPAVEWLLLTTEPATTRAELAAVVDLYRARWIIEEFFKALKTGCSVEQRQLDSYDALLRMCSPYLCRSLTDCFCLPMKTLADALLYLARMGGHLKNNGAPGWQTLARGYQRLSALCDGWEAAAEFA